MPRATPMAEITSAWRAMRCSMPSVRAVNGTTTRPAAPPTMTTSSAATLCSPSRRFTTGATRAAPSSSMRGAASAGVLEAAKGLEGRAHRARVPLAVALGGRAGSGAGGDVG